MSDEKSGNPEDNKLFVFILSTVWFEKMFRFDNVFQESTSIELVFTYYLYNIFLFMHWWKI